MLAALQIKFSTKKAGLLACCTFHINETIIVALPHGQ
jgi:hypothetical protein